MMRRSAAVDALATLVGFTLAGAGVGASLGVAAPGFYRGVLGLRAGELLDPARVGLGFGAVVGFLAGAMVIAVVLAARALAGLWRAPRLGGRRRSYQPTLASLVVAVGLVALALASLRHPSRAGAQLWFGLTALSLASATVAAIVRRPSAAVGERRGFAAGFAVLGWSYLLLSLFPESRAQMPSSDLLAGLEPRISGSWRGGVHFLTLEMGPFPAVERGLEWEPLVTNRGGIPGRLEIDEIQPEFRRIGHSLFALLLGLAGGLVTDLALARGRQNGDSPPVAARGEPR